MIFQRKQWISTGFLFGLLAAGLSLGCARAKVTNLPGGHHSIVCERGMKICVARAEKLCGDEGFTIISGGTTKKLLGGSSSSYRQLSESGRLKITCGELEKDEEQKDYIPLPPRSDEATRSEEEPSKADSTEQVCVPGATQTCVGPGACAGGQVCLEDGSGFGPCDCGEQQAPPSSPKRSSPPNEGSPESPPRNPGPQSPQQPEVPGAMPEPTPL